MKGKIKKFCLILSIVIITFATTGCRLPFSKISSIPTEEHPTREEWLEVYITYRIKEWTDPFQQRIAIRVAIIPKDKQIVVTLSSANGQEELSQAAKNGYVHDVEAIVKNILESYNWAKDYKLTAQYI